MQTSPLPDPEPVPRVSAASFVVRAARRRMAIAFVGLFALSTGCGRPLHPVLLPDGPPELRLDRVRLAAPNPDAYAYLARWAPISGTRTIRHYVYAIDPVSVDAVDDRWVKTKATQQVLVFPNTEKTAAAYRPHVFTVRAVDDQGVMSEPESFAFTEANLPPIVRIINPPPSPAYPPNVPPTIRFTWDGIDPDGQNTTRPVRYVFRLFGRVNPDYPAIPDFISFALTYPDSLRALYAPDFHGWTSVSGDTTSFEYRNLNPGSTYLFVVTGFDEAGDYDPIFSAGKNMLQFGVIFAGTGGPILTMFNGVFNYTYPTGGWSQDPSRWVPVELPADQSVSVNWFATPPEGSSLSSYRWVLDAADLTDETPRTDEETDWYHWSARSLNTTSATFAFGPGSHFLYIEAEDTFGLRSLGIVHISTRAASFSNELLFVDDTRLRPDHRSGPGSQLDPPAGPWPTAAELDSFLFARGGVPWRSYPSGTLSTPGIFNGYDYDTIGTRGISLDGVIPLSVLGRYRHVVWYTDETGASYTGSPQDRSTPITALRLMSSPGHSSALAAYVQQGGNVWLCGGGAAFATLIAWNRPNTSPLEYTDVNNELVPGRFMYDFSHWRSGIQILPAVNARKFGSTSLGVGDNRPGRGWPPNPSPPTPPAPPNYALLPANLDPKNIATDPAPPLRQPDSFWLRGTYSAEYIHRSTLIREDYNDDPDLVDEYSTLDTLYICRGGTALLNSPVMTYYHGRECPPMVFSGFNFWYWRRSQCIELVDWVLQSVWGLPRDPAAPRTPAGPVSARR
jgi:hypothetical protein